MKETPDRINIMGIHIDNVSPAEALNKALSILDGHNKGYIVTPNSEIVYQCRKDKAAKNAIEKAAMTVPDGVGVVYAAKILGTPLKGKVAGIELAEALLPELVKRQTGLFILGAKPGIAELAGKKLAEKVPGLMIAGTNDGYFTDDREVVKKINASGAGVCFVCMGAPKQELWMARNADTLDCDLMLGIGGSVDVFAGVSKRAPKIFIKLGLEWFYRLCKEPKRIGRMVRLPLFLLLVFADKLSGRKWDTDAEG